jgi:predicted ATP-grasp superfamily ATP-dependent carboligase
MSAEQPVLIFGASVRAAAVSALRAGLQPWCADLFADADLRARCPTIRVPAGVYPRGFRRLVDRELPGPWMYTGALENWPLLVEEMARRRPLWGNDASAVLHSREPWYVASLLRNAGLPCPAVRLGVSQLSREHRWLLKPIAGGGGAGIRFRDPATGPQPIRRPAYYQAYVEGVPCSALYVEDGRQARLLGATRQLVGEPWLHAGPFRYCGSLGPLRPDRPLRQALERVGDVLASGCLLRGLFGVDFILRDGLPWPVEVNPRYTASVEVLEHTAGVPALALHRRAFDRAAPDPLTVEPRAGPWLGKAILFAPQALTFPEDGPWLAAVRAPGPLWEPPGFADVPPAGQCIQAGRPVLTFFAQGESEAACLARLREIAADLDCRLFGR